MPTVKGRNQSQIAKVRMMLDWHLDTAAELERSGNSIWTVFTWSGLTCRSPPRPPLPNEQGA
jgi:hypothetical protein